MFVKSFLRSGKWLKPGSQKKNYFQLLCVKRSLSTSNCDVTVVGGGIVGLATARELKIRHPSLSITVLEKEKHLASHQTGHNSGVIHAGIYYTPGSLKAKLCVKGLQMMYKYCDEHNVPYKQVGKLIVAVEQDEVERLDQLYVRAQKNGCTVSMVDAKTIKEIEPHCQGLKAIHSPLTGIIDYGLVARTFGKQFETLGGTIKVDFEVTNFTENSDSNYPLSTHSKNDNTVNSRYVIACGGLYADRLATKSGADTLPKIVPFRGDYLVLKPEKSDLVRGNIYPVPNPKLPFLGFHFTPRMDGSVWLGPNAVLAFKREGYRFFDFDAKDFTEAITFRGFHKLALKNISAGISEFYRLANRGAQVRQLAKFVPELTTNDVVQGPSGVRAQALDSEGNLVDDFIFDCGKGVIGKRMLHVRNAPSPAATSSLAIAEMIADEVKARFEI